MNRNLIILKELFMSGKIILGYYPIRFRAQVSRHLLAYTGLPWEDRKYTDPKTEWFGKDKNQLGFAFPNLPYLIDGQFKLTQSIAINKYIIKRSKKNELLGKCLKDEALVETALGVISDIKTAIWNLTFDKEWQTKIKQAFAKVQAKFDSFANLYGEKQFALGYLTLIDFQFAEFSYYFQKLCPQAYTKYSFLKRVRNGVESLPEIKKYYEQPGAIKSPFAPSFAAISI